MSTKEKLKPQGKLKNKDGEYDPILVQLWYLKELEAANKWIKTVDKLPDEHKYVLICYNKVVGDFIYERVGDFFINRYSEFMDVPVISVTHWMYRPEKPKQFQHKKQVCN